MKNLFKISFLLLLLTGVASCDLDRYPNTGVPEKEAMTNPDEAQQVIFGIYSAFKNAALYSGSLTLGPDLQSDLVYAVEGYRNVYGDIYRWNTKSTDGDVEGVYAGLYQIISRCNFFMDNIGAVEVAFPSSADQEILKKCKGDVYFMRALAYSELIRLYCKAYDPATAENELGVSIVTTYAETGIKPLRSTLAASYRQVLDDLKQAAVFVKRDGYGSPYVTIGVVNALYARVYLYMQDWNNAAEYATKVIDNPSYALQSTQYKTLDANYNDYQVMWRYDDGPEVLWRIAMSYTDRGGALGTLFVGEMTSVNQYYPDFVPAEWVLDLYGDADGRYKAFFSQTQTNYPHGLVWPLVVKYPGNPEIDNGGRPLLTNMPKIFRLAEQYLIRAEAYCRMGGKDKNANEDLTTLRRARITGYGSSSATGDGLLKEIQTERVKELFMEGFRLADLKRWGMGFQREEQPNTVSGPNRLKINKNNPLFTWPIPKHEMDAVEGMQPNESN